MKLRPRGKPRIGEACLWLLAALLLIAGLGPHSAASRENPGLAESESAAIEARGMGNTFSAASFHVVQAPEVTGITPDSGANNGIVQITDLSGSHFQPGAAVTLTKEGQPDIPGGDVSVVSSSTISCAFDLSGVVTGTWNVVVTNVDEQSGVLDDGFTVRSPSYIYFPLVTRNWPIRITAYRSSESWSEETVTWNSQPAHAEAYGSARFTDFAYGWYALDVTGLVKGWVNGIFRNNGLMVRGPESSDSTSIRLRFISRDYSTSLFHPYLEVTYAENSVIATKVTPATTGAPEAQANGPSINAPGLPPTADTLVLEGYPTSNLGIADYLWVGNDQCFQPPGLVARSLLRFDTSEIPAGTPIVQATLHLYLLDACGTGLSTQPHPSDRVPGIPDTGAPGTVEQIIRASD